LNYKRRVVSTNTLSSVPPPLLNYLKKMSDAPKKPMAAEIWAHLAETAWLLEETEQEEVDERWRQEEEAAEAKRKVDKEAERIQKVEEAAEKKKKADKAAKRKEKAQNEWYQKEAVW
jgi:hypothetical protein